MASKNKEEFYKKSGFITRKDAGMVLKINENFE